MLDGGIAGTPIDGDCDDVATPDVILVLLILGDKPLRRREDALPLRRRDRSRRATGPFSGARLDFDEYQLTIVCHDKIELPGPATPVCGDTDKAVPLEPGSCMGFATTSSPGSVGVVRHLG